MWLLGSCQYHQSAEQLHFRVVQLIPAHSGVIGNTLADRKAESAVHNWDKSYHKPVSLRSAVYALSRFIHDPPWKHCRTTADYEKYDEARDQRAINNGKDAVRLAQLRSGHVTYHHLFYSTINPTCPDCGGALIQRSTGWLNARLYFKPEWTFLDDMIFHWTCSVHLGRRSSH